jgi:hypothetical protein
VIHVSGDQTTFIVTMTDGRQVTLVTSSPDPCLGIHEDERVMLFKGGMAHPVIMTIPGAVCFFRATEVH